MMDLFGWDGAVPKLRTNRTDPIRSRELRIESWALGTGIQELGTEAKPRLMVQLAKWLRLWVRQPCGLGANMLSGDLEMEMVRQMADGRWEMGMEMEKQQEDGPACGSQVAGLHETLDGTTKWVEGTGDNYFDATLCTKVSPSSVSGLALLHPIGEYTIPTRPFLSSLSCQHLRSNLTWL